MIKIKSFTFNPFMENTYVISDETNKGVIIDPGCYEHFEKVKLVNYIDKEKIKVERLLNTHCHIDHVFGNAFVKETYKIGLEIHEKDVETLRAVEVYAPSYGFQHFEPTNVDNFFEENNDIIFGNTSLKVLFAPGHSPGHVVFYHAEEKFCIGGDVLFKESIGRTDLPGGNHYTLINSIQSKLFMLPDDTTLYCGHGEQTTIGHEKINNPFCAINKYK